MATTPRRNAFRVTFDFDAADQLASRLERASERALLRLSAVDVVNEVATRFDRAARRGMNEGINLSDDYIARRMQFIRAAGVPRAEIVARGFRSGGGTVMSNFPYRQLTTPAPRAKGDPKRGIPAGAKRAGIEVEIARGSPESVEHWFTMTLRRGTAAGDKVGVFYRNKAGDVEHKYGPAPYSLFRFQIERRADDLADDLRTTTTRTIGDALERALR